LVGLKLAVLIAAPLGILAATRPVSGVDYLCRVLVTAEVSLPAFFTSLFLISVYLPGCRCFRGGWTFSTFLRRM
jgi:peptide/nickel transport system permease protein